MNNLFKLIGILFFGLFTSSLMGQEIDLRIKLGENELPAQLFLSSTKEASIGILQITMPIQLNVSMKERYSHNDSTVYHCSSPVLEIVIAGSPEDSISGQMSLNNGATFSFSGRYKKIIDKKVFSDMLSKRKTVIEMKEYGVAFPSVHPELDLIVFSAYQYDFTKHQLFFGHYDGKKCGPSKPLPFSIRYSDRSPKFDLQGDRLYFASKRPISENDSTDDYNLWYVELNNSRDPSSWSEPKLVEKINSEADDYQPCVANSGIYFASNREGGFGGPDIYFAKGKGGTFETSVNLGPKVNTEHDEMSVYVNSTEELMIIGGSNSKLQNKGNDDLFLYKKNDGKWQFEHTLSTEINTLTNDYGAEISSDGKWLFITSDIVPPAKIYRYRWKSK